MTFLEAAIEVLRNEPEPLHFAEIAKRAVDRHLLSHVGRDPEAAMRTCLNSAVRGDQAILTRNKPGYYAITPGVELPPPPTPPESAKSVADKNANDAEAKAAKAQVASRAEPPLEASPELLLPIVSATPVAATPAATGDSGEGDEGDEGDEGGEAEGGEAEDNGDAGRGEGGGRRKRRRSRFGVRGEAPPPQQVAIKPSRRGVDPGKRSEVLQKVNQLEFEAPRGAGLDGVTDVALVMANAMSRLAEERPELRNEFESMQRIPAPILQPTVESRHGQRKPLPRDRPGGQNFSQGHAQAQPAVSHHPAGNGSQGGLADDDDRGGRRRRRRRKRGRRVEWTAEGGGDVRGGAEAQSLLVLVAGILGDAGSRSLHIRQIAEHLASQNVLGGEISEIERAVTAGILLDVRKLGRASRFVARGDARYQLQTSRLPGPAAAAEQALRAAVDALDAETTNQLVLWLQSLGPRSLEALVRMYLEREGYGLVATLPPTRGVGKLVVLDPESDEEDGRLLALVLPRKTTVDASAWAGDAERSACGGYLVFAMGEAPAGNEGAGEARTIHAHEFARWLRTQGIGVSTMPIEVTVLDPTVIESIGGLDT